MSDINTNTPIEASNIPDGGLEEVRRRRMLAFGVDYLFILILSFIAGIIVFFFGIITLGLGWLLYGAVIPITAFVYFLFTLAGPAQATPGMRMFSLQLLRYNGKRIDLFVSVLHLLLFWAGNIVLPGVILLASLFTKDKRLVHDILLETVMVRSDVR